MNTDWVACVDREPPDGYDECLVSNKYGEIYIAVRNINEAAKWVWIGDQGQEIGLTYGHPVTHWMTLPTAP